MSRAVLAGLLVHTAAGCWGGGLTEEVCCDLSIGPAGNPRCWDAEFTFERCCRGQQQAQASADVEGLSINPSVVPSLPLLGGGSMPMAGVGLCCRPSAQGDAVRQGVLDYLLMGGRHLDDADLYSNHREVGLGIRQAIDLGVPRKEIFVTTKIWPNDYGFEATNAWVQKILEELGLDYVDLVLLHKAGVNAKEMPCKTPKACRQETWLALQRARERGEVRNLGVSNFGPRQMGELNALGGAPITVNQFEYHPWVPQVHRDTAEWCHQNGIAVTAYGSMGSSSYASQMVNMEMLMELGRFHAKTGAQVLLRWAIQKNVSVIPGTSNPKHMAENLGIFDFVMSEEEVAFLDNGVPEEQRMLHFGHTPDEDE